MRERITHAGNRFAKLFRFLFWYAVTVAFLFYLLPMAGLFLESRYDALGSTAKFLAVVGFFSVVAAWQVISMRERLRKALAE